MSDNNILYSILIKIRRGKQIVPIKIYNSLTLLPLSVHDLAINFGLEEKKGSINYNKRRPVGYKLTDTEVDYLKNDCVIVGKCLQIANTFNINKLTIGSSALSKYTALMGGKKKLRYTFPLPNYDSDIRPAYKGGWCYANPKYSGKIVGKGIVLDVNSLYPYVLRNKLLPYGTPLYKKGRPEPLEDYPLYIVSFNCSFKLKKDKLPTVQIKNSLYFLPTKYLENSNEEIVNLVMTNIDYELFCEHYDIDDLSFIGTYYFKASSKFFTEYIDYYVNLKIESDKKGNKALRQLCKLMLNSLYGKFAVNPKIISKYPYIDDESGIVKYGNMPAEYRDPLYVALAIFVTSQARNITIRAAQANYHRFLYSDTDSIHLKGYDLPKNIKIDNYELGAWKLEKHFTKAKFLRAKTYIELNSDTKNIDITCCGMPNTCYSQVTFDNFNIGTIYQGKLSKRHVKGGTILTETTFNIRG